MRMMSSLILALAVVGASVLPAAETSTAAALKPSPTPVFAPGETAAAYAVDEHIYGHENHVVGKDLSVTAELLSQGEQRQVRLTVAANRFKTDSGLRDMRVRGFLGGSKPMVITTDWFPAADLAKLAQGSYRLPAAISVKGQAAQPLTLSAQADGVSVRVDAVTSFKDLGLSPPSLGLFGMLGEVHQPLTLSAQVQLDRVIGYK